ncbi:hypothetical protein HDZ31DRAFT_49342, partial [Schizophyllum fasciatum]
LRKLAYKVINSTTKLLPAWQACLREHDLRETNIPRDVSTRWNSTYDMVDYVDKHKKALKAYLADDAHTFELEPLTLSPQEWRCVRDLRNVLKQATLYFSRDDTPNLASVIPAMDRLDSALATSCVDESLEPSIRAAINIAKATLNKYYSKTDDSDTYRVAMGAC